MKIYVQIVSLVLFFCYACENSRHVNQHINHPKPEYSIDSIFDITLDAAKCKVTLIHEGLYQIWERGVCVSKIKNPEVKDNITIVMSKSESFTEWISGLEMNTRYYVRVWATNQQGTFYSPQLEFKTANITTGRFTETIEGNTYKWVKIGEQIWMAENLRSTKFSDGSNIPNVTNSTDWKSTETSAYCWYMNNEERYKQKYGALYNYYTVETGKLCPSGWHVPTNDEWLELELYLGMDTHDIDGTGSRGQGVGTKLKSTSGWFGNGYGTNLSKFCALPGSARFSRGSFDEDVGKEGAWWAVNPDKKYAPLGRYLYYNRHEIFALHIDPNTALSVRCVRD